MSQASEFITITDEDLDKLISVPGVADHIRKIAAFFPLSENLPELGIPVDDEQPGAPVDDDIEVLSEHPGVDDEQPGASFDNVEVLSRHPGIPGDEFTEDESEPEDEDESESEDEEDADVTKAFNELLVKYAKQSSAPEAAAIQERPKAPEAAAIQERPKAPEAAAIQERPSAPEADAILAQKVQAQLDAEASDATIAHIIQKESASRADASKVETKDDSGREQKHSDDPEYDDDEILMPQEIPPPPPSEAFRSYAATAPPKLRRSSSGLSDAGSSVSTAFRAQPASPEFGAIYPPESRQSRGRYHKKPRGHRNPSVGHHRKPSFHFSHERQRSGDSSHFGYFGSEQFVNHGTPSVYGGSDVSVYQSAPVMNLPVGPFTVSLGEFTKIIDEIMDSMKKMIKTPSFAKKVSLQRKTILQEELYKHFEEKLNDCILAESDLRKVCQYAHDEVRKIINMIGAQPNRTQSGNDVLEDIYYALDGNITETILIDVLNFIFQKK